MRIRQSIMTRTARPGSRGQETSGCTIMDETDFSEDTTYKQQEDLPYDGDLSQMNICSDYNFPSKQDTLEVSKQVIPANDLQEKPAPAETYRNTALTRLWDKITENAANRKCDKEKQCITSLHMSATKGDDSKSNFSDIFLHHVSKEQFLKGQGIDSETLPKTSNGDSFDEAAIIKNIISRYIKNSCPKEQTVESTDQPSSKRDVKNSNKPNCSPVVTLENNYDLEKTVASGGSSHEGNLDFLTKIKEPSDKQKNCQGQTPQKQLIETVSSSSNGLKYSQGQVHYQLPNFSKVAPKVKIPKTHITNKPLTIAKQGDFSPKLRNKSAILQDILDILFRSNGVEKQHPEQKRESTEPSQQIQMEPIEYNNQEFLTGIETKTNLLKLPSISQKEPYSNSYIDQRIAQGKQMCQKLKEQTDQLKTKVQEFSKRMKQDSFCHLKDRRMVLENLQGHLNVLEQEFLATKKKHLALQQQIHKHESPTGGDLDPNREVEGEIFKLEVLLEDAKEKFDESKSTSAASLPVSSLVTLEDFTCTASSSLNEVTEEHPGGPPGPQGLCQVPGEQLLEAPREELPELVKQTPSGDSAAQDPPDQLDGRSLSSDSREDPSSTWGRQKCAETLTPSPSCAFCCRLLEWKQKMEKKGHRRINCGRFSIVIHEKGLRQGSTLGSDTEPSICSDSDTGLPRNKRENFSNKIHNSRRVCSKEPLKEFHYRYNTPGLNYLNHGRRGVFVQPLDENKNSSPLCPKPKRICSQRVNSKSFQDEHEPIPGKISGNKSLCDFNSIEETESKILNSALDHALKTATILKKLLIK